MSDIGGKVDDPKLAKIVQSLQKTIANLSNRINKLEKDKANKEHTH